ncbi:MAG: hypothetical protein Q8L68_02775, partial [Methylococcales bacterium]|nr:hypothetical protein [Methylococcales bacterium]
QFAPAQNMHELKPFSREEACNYIKTRLPETTDKHANDLALHLNDLPLALSQAIELISVQDRISPEKHIEDYISDNNLRAIMTRPTFISSFVGSAALGIFFILRQRACHCPQFQNLIKISPDHYQDFVTNCTYIRTNFTIYPFFEIQEINYIAIDCSAEYYSVFTDLFFSNAALIYSMLGLIVLIPMLILPIQELIIFGINPLIPKENIKAVRDKIIAYPYIDGALFLLSARNLFNDSRDHCDKMTLEFQYYAVYVQLFVSMLRSHAAVTKFMRVTKVQDLSLDDKQKILNYNLLHYYSQIALSMLAAVSMVMVMDNVSAKTCLSGKIMEKIVYACNIMSAALRLGIYKQEHKLSTRYRRLDFFHRTTNEEDEHQITETYKIRLDRHE